MILDAQNMFCEAQALPNGTTSISTNVIDLKVTARHLTWPLSVMLSWSGTPVGTSVMIQLRSSDNVDLTTSPVVHWSTGIIPQADYAAQGLASGAQTFIKLPWPTTQPSLSAGGSIDDSTGYKRYLGLHFTTVGDASAGLLTSGLVETADMQHYPTSGYTLGALA